MDVLFLFNFRNQMSIALCFELKVYRNLHFLRQKHSIGKNYIVDYKKEGVTKKN